MNDYTRSMSSGNLREHQSAVFDSVKCNPKLSIAVQRHNRTQAYVVSEERASLTFDLNRKQLIEIRDAIDVFLDSSDSENIDLLDVVRAHRGISINGAIDALLGPPSKKENLANTSK